jgi:putative membrane-bound dehydrogenase-like protein
MPSLLRYTWPVLFLLAATSPALPADPTNEPESAGVHPVGDDGRTLNLDFEKGDLSDWTATGEAWKNQPIKGGIDQNRQFGMGKRSLHTGEYWVGGYEKFGDAPTGNLTSVPFKVSHPWASFLLGGGSHPDTRVELVEVGKDGKEAVFYRVSAENTEEMRPVIVDLGTKLGRKIFVRLVDGNSTGWGHVNFDDFRFYQQKPKFQQPELRPAALISVTEVYPYEGLMAEEAAQVMTVPPGFRVQVAAAEPEVQQPIAMCLDDRGRLWLAEGFSYPEREEVGKGKDRILIFEDTDQDGTLDKHTVFIEGLNLVSGLEVGFGGVWVGAAPYFMFIPDKNGNDVPDGLEGPQDKNRPASDIPPGATVLLDGWHYEDTHETLNTFTWGPDGWLYGCHGVFTHSRVGKPGTAEDQRQVLNAGIWRYHPTKHLFEVFSEGTSNPWGIDFDEHGQAFCTACVIPHLYHLIDGGRYFRQAGPHANPYTYSDIATIAKHRHYTGNQWNDNDRKKSDDLGGGHAHAGAMIYQGGSWPAEYVGKLFMHNIHGNRINVDVLTPQGSGFSGDRNPDFLLTGDKWSQMLNLQYGPDGQVWMIDWYDANQCHRPEEGLHDRTNGRIYRVSYNNAPNVKVDLAKSSDDDLAKTVDAENEWYYSHARRLLQERAVSRKIEMSAVNFLEERLTQKGNDPKRLRALWMLHAISRRPINEKEEIVKLLDDESPWIRSWTIQLTGERLGGYPAWDAAIEKFVEMAKNDPSPVVRLYLSSIAQRLPAEQRWDLLAGLCSHAGDNADQNLPFMYWYAMEPLAAANPERALALAMSASEDIPSLQTDMVQRLGSGDPQKSLDLLAKGLDGAKDSRSRLTFLRGINAILRGKKDISGSKTLAAVAEKLSGDKDAAVRVEALAVALRLGNAKAGGALQQVIATDSNPRETRRAALRCLVDAKAPQLAEVLQKLLDDAAMRGDAIRAVAVVDSDPAAEKILAVYSALTPTERRDALGTLASRVLYAHRLLASVQGNVVPKADLSADLVRQLRNLNDESLTKQLEQVWGVVRETAADKAAMLVRYKALLDKEEGPPRDREHGRAIFSKTCQQCHTLFGTGGKVGPDLTGSNRVNTEYLLANIVDPSAVMAKEYRPTMFALVDGRVITGIVKDEAGTTYSVQTATELLTFPKEDVEQSKQSDLSMMPDDQLKNFSDAEIRALAAYLQGAGQTAISGTRENITGFFNGLDLTNWFSTTEQAAANDSSASQSSPPLWTVEDGELVGKTTGLNHNEFLVSQYSLGDFRFRCEVKLVKNEGNSGIQLRSVPAGNAEMKGYQADIGVGWWGKLYEELGRGLLEDNDAEKFARPGEWNTYEIVAVGSRVQTWINGNLCVDRDDPVAARRGVIALQLHAGGPTEVRYRNFKVEILEPNPQRDRIQPPNGQSEYPTSRALGMAPAAPAAPLGATVAVAAGAADATPPRAVNGDEIRFEKTQLDDKFRSEGVGIADLDNDGDQDIVAGSQWYEQSKDADGHISWKTHVLLEKPNEFDPAVYSDSFMNWAEDLNGDGRLDVIVVDFPGKQTWWFENPGTGKDARSVWTRHEITPVTNNESPQYLDVDGDGHRELICGYEGQTMGLVSPKTYADAIWKLTPISPPGSPGTDRFSHGLGVGDLNGDGRKDVLIIEGWWEQPADPEALPWTFHAAPFGKPCSHMQVYDYDGDGDADVLSASAHDYGIWWHENLSKDPKASPGGADGSSPEWATHDIDTSYSETHSVVLADVNNDGKPDFVTGKRWYSHGGHGPGGMEPAVLNWYEFKQEQVEEKQADGKSITKTVPKWTKHAIDDNSGVGTQFDMADIDGDGLLDIAISNKKGSFVFLQRRK